MPNQAGIDDHNGDKAIALAAGYQSIDRKAIQPELFSHLEEAAQRSESLRVLDVGCGSGDDAYLIAQMGHQVVGVDPSDLLDIAKRDHAHERIDYRKGLLPELNCLQEGEQFDVINLSAVWQYIDPAERVDSLIKIANHLEPTGKLILLYPSPPSREHQFEASPEMLNDEIAQANKRLPAGKKLSLTSEPTILPDSRGRKSADGRDIHFYTYTIGSGHTRSLGDRSGRVITAS